MTEKWQASRDRMWDHSRDAFESFTLAEGRLPERYHDAFNGVRLRSWLQNARRLLREGALRSDRRSALDGIWSGWEEPQSETARWIDSALHLQELIRDSGGSPTWSEGPIGTRASAWLARQRRHLRIGRLSELQSEMLDSIFEGWRDDGAASPQPMSSAIAAASPELPPTPMIERLKGAPVGTVATSGVVFDGQVGLLVRVGDGGWLRAGKSYSCDDVVSTFPDADIVWMATVDRLH